MAKNFAEIAFSDAVKALQEKHGSRKGYERMEKFNVIDGLSENEMGFIDFSGNKQYISVGNFVTNNNVALIMMDYPARARLKILAKAEIVELKDNPELLSQLDLGEYQFRPERMMLFHIEAFDWNCPQHITQRFTVEEIQIAFEPLLQYISKLEKEIENLKNRLKDSGLN